MFEKKYSSWIQKPLSDLGRYVNGFAFKSDDWKPQGLPIVRIAQITGSSSECDYYQGTLSDAFKIDSGDLIFSWSGTLKVVEWNGGPAWLNQHLFKVIPSLEVHPRFLYHILAASVEEMNKRAHGSTMKHIKRNELKEYLVYLPSNFDEQKTIANILDTLDTQIRQTEAIIAKLQQVKQGLLNDLLTRGIDENGQLRPPYEQAPELYKKSPQGWIPKMWDFGDVGKALSSGCLIAIQDGNHGEIHPKTSDFVEEGIPFVMANDIVDGNIKFEACYKITRKQFEGLRIGFARKDDVLLSHKGTVGQVAVVPSDVDEIMLTPQVTYYRCQTDRLLPKFLAIWFQTSCFKEKLLSLSAQSTRAYIGILGQRQLPFMFIPHDEQLEIVSFYGPTEERLALEHRALRKLKKQKSGLMDDLLTGRVRVTELIDQQQQAS